MHVLSVVLIAEARRCERGHQKEGGQSGWRRWNCAPIVGCRRLRRSDGLRRKRKGGEAKGTQVGGCGKLRRIEGCLVGLVPSRGDHNLIVFPNVLQLRPRR